MLFLSCAKKSVNQDTNIPPKDEEKSVNQDTNIPPKDEEKSMNQDIFTPLSHYSLTLNNAKFDIALQSMGSVSLNVYEFLDASSKESMPVMIMDNGKDVTLVRLHGGPGASPLYWADDHFNEEDKKEILSHLSYFTSHTNYVFWQQRGSNYAEGSDTPPTLQQMRTDLRELVIQLRIKFGSDHKIILVGHSWGGTYIYDYLTQDYDNHYVDAVVIDCSPVDYSKKVGVLIDAKVDSLDGQGEESTIDRIIELKNKKYGDADTFRDRFKDPLQRKQAFLDYLVLDNVIILQDAPFNKARITETEIQKTYDFYSNWSSDSRSTISVFLKMMPQLLASDTYNRLNSIPSIPILIQHGINDHVAPVSEVDEICANIQSCSNDSIKKYDAGHQIFLSGVKEDYREDRLNFILQVINKN